MGLKIFRRLERACISNHSDESTGERARPVHAAAKTLIEVLKHAAAAALHPLPSSVDGTPQGGEVAER